MRSKQYKNPIQAFPNVADYASITEFLHDSLAYKKLKNPQFSMRSWSSQLDLKSPGYLANVLAGRRPPSKALLDKIIVNLQLSTTDAKKLFVLAQLGGASESIEPNMVDQAMKSIHERQEEFHLPISKFRLIEDWFNIAILEMFKLKNLQGTTSEIQSKLVEDLSIGTIDAVLTRLQRLKLLVADSEGKLTRSNNTLFVGENIPSEVIRNYHINQLKLSESALRNQDIHDRENLSMTLAVKLENIPLIKRHISEFKDKLHSLTADIDAEAVYQVNVQGFFLTKKAN